MAQQDVRYFLNGLYLEVGNGRIKAVATDGHRMAIADCESPKGTTLSTHVIVPRKAIQELARLLATDDGQLTLSFSQNRVRIEATGAVITSKLIDGKFPDYTKVIPKNQGKQIPLNRNRFREALGRAAILANEKYKGVKLGLQAGSLQISAHNPEQEEAVEEVETSYVGESLEIGFNVTYLLEATNALSSEEITVGLNDPNSSCTIQSAGETGVQYVVMPMRL
jgi:DNA polymerase-3 subunit beta